MRPAVLSTLNALSNLILSVNLYQYLPFYRKEHYDTERFRNCPQHTASKHWSQDLNPSCLIFFVMLLAKKENLS